VRSDAIRRGLTLHLCRLGNNNHSPKVLTMYATQAELWEDLNALGIYWEHAEAGEGGETDATIVISKESKEWLDNNFEGWEG